MSTRENFFAEQTISFIVIVESEPDVPNLYKISVPGVPGELFVSGTRSTAVSTARLALKHMIMDMTSDEIHSLRKASQKRPNIPASAWMETVTIEIPKEKALAS